MLYINNIVRIIFITLSILMLIGNLSCKVREPLIKDNLDKSNFTLNYIDKYTNFKKPDYLLIENANLKVENENINNLNVLIYLEREEKIFISGKVFGFEVFRFMLTKDSVFFIDRINRNYFFDNWDNHISIIPENLSFRIIQNFIYSGIYESSNLNRKTIKNEFIMKDSLYYKRDYSGNSTMDFYYELNANLKKLVYTSPEKSMGVSLEFERTGNNIIKGLILSGENETELLLIYNDYKIVPYRKTEFKVGKNYHEGRLPL